MGFLEDEGNRSGDDSRKDNLGADLSDMETQQIESQFSPGGISESDGDGDFIHLMNTMPVDDACLFEDAFETQLVNLAGETQVVDLAGETQVLDDFEFLNEFSAEVGGASKCGGTYETQALCETQVLSEDDTMKIDCNISVGLKSTMGNYPPKHVDNSSGAPSDTYSNEEHQSGSIRRGFTSIRAASTRASGLAARARGANHSLCTTSSDKSSLEQQTCEREGSSVLGYMSKSGRENDQECTENEYDEDCEEPRNSIKVGSTAVRKLFEEGKIDEVDQSEVGINQTDDNLNKPDASENCLAGLSYANSQEPGELSQAYALEVVDRFLDLNVMEYDEGFGSRVHHAGKSKVVSAAKGSRDLAKSSILKSTDGECGIYDWDDTREDDGGGDFFLKKKELFFDKESPKKRCLTEPRKPRYPDVRGVKSGGNNGDGKGQKDTKSKLGDLVYSDSGLILHKLRAKGKSLYCGEEAVNKDLTKDFDEQLKVVSGPQLADNDTNKDVQDTGNIGPDTQIAAEAMETLCFEVHLADGSSNGPNKGAVSKAKATRKNQMRNRTVRSEQCRKIPYPASVRVTRQSKQIKRTSIDASNGSSLSPKQSKKIRKGHDNVLGEAEQRRLADVNVFSYHGTESTDQSSEKKSQLEEQLSNSAPVAHRTRKYTELNGSKAADNSFDAVEEINDLISTRVVRKRRTAVKDKNAEMVTKEKVRKVGSTGSKSSNGTCVGTFSAVNIDMTYNLRGKRSQQEKSFEHEANTQCSGRLKRSREVGASTSVNPGSSHLNQLGHGSALSSLDTQSGKILLHRTVGNGSSRNDAAERDSDCMDAKASLHDAVDTSTSKQHDEKTDDETSTEGAETNGKAQASPRERCGTSSSACVTPATCTTPINNVSPICMGDEYHKQSCRKNLSRFSLIREINNLVTGSPGPYSGMKDLRKRKDITNIRVLFSQHLDVDVTKQQKRILARLGGAVASSMSDATHFVADEFVRTRNMLEAIASGKPVVTHLWLESCGEASCLIDEKNYILRDAKKEREFGFSLPVSLSRACQHPLLEGQKVLVTPNTKPGKDILANLVKAVHGVAVERLGRSVLKDEKLPDDLLILSCEEDYDVCVPFLEKGGAVYSSELLLNGIVKQKLEYERHRLFADHVRRTRSTIWVKKKNQYLPEAIQRKGKAMKFLDWYLKIGVVSAMIGGSMELFMIKTGFYDKVTVLESEKRAWESSPEAQAIREALNPWRDHDKQTRKSS
ncbi:hypothetical protein Salat_0558600 [Sesamum alatum]|uniref:BRCT domain-containing protein n=1 Tax=Sesamum alatum TaxID=300844 RepID=A0AAE1YPQ4_9LAMI|nr:hypothetical protein Salat_0558600 [Sesamum alatum]